MASPGVFEANKTLEHVADHFGGQDRSFGGQDKRIDQSW